mgnify:CR=1 FL=1
MPVLDGYETTQAIRAGSHVMTAAPDVRQHEVVDSTDPRLRVKQANGNAGAEQCRERARRLDCPGAWMDRPGQALDLLRRSEFQRPAPAGY